MQNHAYKLNNFFVNAHQIFTSFQGVGEIFNRAIMWQKEQQHPCVAISGEREDITVIGKAGEIAILSSQSIGHLSESALKTVIKSFRGFELLILELTKVLHLISVIAPVQISSICFKQIAEHLVILASKNFLNSKLDCMHSLVTVNVHQQNIAKVLHTLITRK